MSAGRHDRETEGLNYLRGFWALGLALFAHKIGRRLGVLGVVASLGAAGCAAYGGATLLAVPTELISRRGFALTSPVAIQTPIGTRFHGSVCRKSPMPSPTRIRLERVSASENVLASASRPLSGLGGRGNHCTFYDMPTDWTVGAGERVRVCALRLESACTPNAPRVGLPLLLNKRHRDDHPD